jgi:hypothetical protein
MSGAPPLPPLHLPIPSLPSTARRPSIIQVTDRDNSTHTFNPLLISNSIDLTPQLPNPSVSSRSSLLSPNVSRVSSSSIPPLLPPLHSFIPGSTVSSPVLLKPLSIKIPSTERSSNNSKTNVKLTVSPAAFPSVSPLSRIAPLSSSPPLVDPEQIKTLKLKLYSPLPVKSNESSANQLSPSHPPEFPSSSLPQAFQESDASDQQKSSSSSPSSIPDSLSLPNQTQEREQEEEEQEKFKPPQALSSVIPPLNSSETSLSQHKSLLSWSDNLFEAARSAIHSVVEFSSSVTHRVLEAVIGSHQENQQTNNSLVLSARTRPQSSEIHSVKRKVKGEQPSLGFLPEVSMFPSTSSLSTVSIPDASSDHQLLHALSTHDLYRIFLEFDSDRNECLGIRDLHTIINDLRIQNSTSDEIIDEMIGMGQEIAQSLEQKKKKKGFVESNQSFSLVDESAMELLASGQLNFRHFYDLFHYQLSKKNHQTINLNDESPISYEELNVLTDETKRKVHSEIRKDRSYWKAAKKKYQKLEKKREKREKTEIQRKSRAQRERRIKMEKLRDQM